jgi:1-acyl-sn-glycerol-3-phosphate acyltransferase
MAEEPDAAAPLPIQLRGSRIARLALRAFGWRVVFRGLPSRQGVLSFYPHTSNWDFVVGMLAKWAIGIPIVFWGKDALFDWPLFGRWLRWIGGIPVDRKSAHGRVHDMAARFAAARAADRFLWLALAPEGTRRYVPGWRSGFYHVALEAGVPLGLAFVDYPTRRIGVENFLVLSGDRAADMAAIAAPLAHCRGRRPELAAPIRLQH